MSGQHVILKDVSQKRFVFIFNASFLKEVSQKFFVCDLQSFPECVARVPVSLGGLGVRLCSPKVAFATATVRNRSQPFATVGNRPQPSVVTP